MPTGFGRGARFALRVRAVERPSFRPAFTVKTASYNKSLLVSRTSALGERHIEKSTFLMLVRQRSAKKSRLRATSQVECAAPRRRPGLPRTPRSFLPVGPSPPRFWGLAAPRGATRGNRLNSRRLASASNSALDCLALSFGRARGAVQLQPYTQNRSKKVVVHRCEPRCGETARNGTVATVLNAQLQYQPYGCQLRCAAS